MENFKSFINELDLLDHIEIVTYCNKEAKNAEYLLKKAPKNNSHSELKYYQFVSNAAIYFGEGFIAPGFTREDFQLLKPIVERLVKAGSYRPESLQVFESRS